MKRIQWIKWAACAVAVLLLSGGCEKSKDNADDTVLQNEFALLLMSDVYLWNQEAISTYTSQNLSTDTEKDPIAFYEKLIYKDDSWSFMTDNVAYWDAIFSGTSTTFGYSLDFRRMSNNNVFAIVQFVYPGTPAEKAGIRRGDLLISMNGGAITVDNYRDMYMASSLKIGFGVYDADENAIRNSDRTPVTLTAVEMYEDPILYHDIIEKGGKKIGYLLYTDYHLDVKPGDNQALLNLANVFSGFQNERVDEVILDLRYNGGGYAITSEFLCNILAPESAINSKAVMTVQTWNKKYGAENNSSTRFGNEVHFSHEGKQITVPVPVNMNLNRLYVLTSDGTASASESTIVGLKPYLDVILVGSRTSGKNCGGILFDRGSYGSTRNIEALRNWGAYTMVYKFTNKNNEVFVGGFVPQYAATEDIFNLVPFGDESDPLLAKVLEVITGIPSQAGKARAVTDHSRFMAIPNAQTRTNRLDGRMIDLRSPDEFKEIQ